MKKVMEAQLMHCYAGYKPGAIVLYVEDNTNKVLIRDKTDHYWGWLDNAMFLRPKLDFAHEAKQITNSEQFDTVLALMSKPFNQVKLVANFEL